MSTKTLGWGLVLLVNRVRKALGFLLVFSAVGGRAWAGGPVPEIDPGFAAGALTLVIGGLLMLTDKRRRS